MEGSGDTFKRCEKRRSKGKRMKEVMVEDKWVQVSLTSCHCCNENHHNEDSSKTTMRAINPCCLEDDDLVPSVAEYEDIAGDITGQDDAFGPLSHGTAPGCLFSLHQGAQGWASRGLGGFSSSSTLGP